MSKTGLSVVIMKRL